MKKLNKRNDNIGNTIQAFSCYCSCTCGCGCSCSCGILFWTSSSTSSNTQSSTSSATLSTTVNNVGSSNYYA